MVEEVLSVTQEPTLPMPEEEPQEDIQIPVSTVAAEEPLPTVEEEPVADEESEPVMEESIVEEPQPAMEESIIDDEPQPEVEESIIAEEPQPVVEEPKAETPEIEQIDDEAPATQQLVTASAPLMVAGLSLDDIEEELNALREKAQQEVTSYKMTESKSTTDSTTSDYSGSVCSDREEDEEEVEEKREVEVVLQEIKEEIEEHEEEEEEADVKVVMEAVDEPEEVVSDNELTPQAPEYTPPAPAVELEEETEEELAFTPTPPVELPPAFGLCEKRGIREIADPRERHMHHAWIQQLVSAPAEESLTSSDDSHMCDESDCDGSPPLSPVSSIDGVGHAGVPESLGMLAELDLAAEKMEKMEVMEKMEMMEMIEEVEEIEKTNKIDEIEEELELSAAVPPALAPQTTQEAPADKELSPEAPPADLISAASDPTLQEIPIVEKELVPIVEITPMQGKDGPEIDSQNGSESGRAKEVQNQKRKKKAPVKRQANKKKYSKKAW